MTQETMKALTLHQTEGEFKPGPDVWHPIKLEQVPVPTPERGQPLLPASC